MTTRTDSTTTTTSTTTTSTTTTSTTRTPDRSVKKILTDQCWVDCELNNNYVSNPACLLDCFPAHHCLSSLLLDVTGAGGVCRGSFTSQYFSSLWPTSDRTCTFLAETDQDFTAREDHQIKAGLCSAQTEALLVDQEKCILPLYQQADSVLISLKTLIWSTCSWQTFQAWRPLETPEPTTVTSPPRTLPTRRRGVKRYNFGKI